MANTPVEEDLWNEFHRVVNMTSRELRDWLRVRSADRRGGALAPPPDVTGARPAEGLVEHWPSGRACRWRSNASTPAREPVPDFPTAALSCHWPI